MRPVAAPARPGRPGPAARATRASRRPGSAPTRRSGTSTFSAAVRIGTSPNVWKTKATVRRRSVDELARRPARRPRAVQEDPPAVGRSSPPSRLSSVVLPLPERPRTASSSPRGHGQVDPAERVDDAVAGRRSRGRGPSRDHRVAASAAGPPAGRSCVRPRRASVAPPRRRAGRSGPAPAVRPRGRGPRGRRLGRARRRRGRARGGAGRGPPGRAPRRGPAAAAAARPGRAPRTPRR